MGEGNPGVSVTRAFYDKARELADKCVFLSSVIGIMLASHNLITALQLQQDSTT
jgi:hypothetical protein